MAPKDKAKSNQPTSGRYPMQTGIDRFVVPGILRPEEGQSAHALALEQIKCRIDQLHLRIDALSGRLDSQDARIEARLRTVDAELRELPGVIERGLRAALQEIEHE